MTDIVLVFDDNDIDTDEVAGLGYFFKACASDIKTHFKSSLHNLIEIHGNNLNSQYVNQVLESLSSKKFIFLAYSHGSESALLYDNQTKEYVSISNSIEFLNTFVYTWSCSTGKELGKELIDNGALAFIGYDNLTYAGTGETDLFVETANWGIKQFVLGSQVKTVFYSMRDKYSEVIDFLQTEKNDFFVASFFRKNRDALVLHGNNITISDLHNA